MRIAGFDPGARFGFAYFDLPEGVGFKCPSSFEEGDKSTWSWGCREGVDSRDVIISKLRMGAWDLSASKREGPGMMWVRLENYLAELSADFFVYELARGHWRSGDAEYYYNGGVAMLEAWAVRAGVKAYDSVHVGTLKKFATGSGRCNKKDIVDAVNEQFSLDLRYYQDDEADAAFLLKWAVTNYGETLGATGVDSSAVQTLRSETEKSSSKKGKRK